MPSQEGYLIPLGSFVHPGTDYSYCLKTNSFASSVPLSPFCILGVLAVLLIVLDEWPPVRYTPTVGLVDRPIRQPL
ncbi:hypothetical protein N7509_008716 [Penicillium cosmopolitanum]|uniref:Uncharacterized protein n=1 Tax=Penicillium cosmopolitanum TaxID=1131564 RepID=A0A9W9VN57_9EURO|nr:uncharacterized protein N7509_008716 [Penicillium cosmopolitanum]KAJ5386175.1 hypothetical protein N7509_008716 [Penicillium cosmopolitanum]